MNSTIAKLADEFEKILYPLTRYKRLYAMKHERKGLQIAFVISR